MPNFTSVITFESELDLDALTPYANTAVSTLLESGKALAPATMAMGPDGLFRLIVSVDSIASGNELLNQIYAAAKQQSIKIVCTVVDTDAPNPIAAGTGFTKIIATTP